MELRGLQHSSRANRALSPPALRRWQHLEQVAAAGQQYRVPANRLWARLRCAVYFKLYSTIVASSLPYLV